MTSKTDILIAILKHSNTGLAKKRMIVREANVPVTVANNILRDLRELRLIEYENETIELTSNQRINLAIHAINQGTDIERVCKVLEWIEFENFTATAFEKNNYAVKRRFRFKAAQRRWEIDVLAYSEPIIVCVDCKRWRRGWGNSAINRMAAAQAQRTEVLSKSLQDIQHNIDLTDWEAVSFFPVIISLFPGPVKFYNKVPVVPILQLQNFLDEFQGHKNEITHFCSKIGPRITDYLKNKE
jgi:predicted transcriptional regulator/Holliday junction resolvase-like predicted endonuclease